MEQTTVINFNPEVNETLMRIFELQKTIKNIQDTEDEYFKKNEDYAFSLLLNLTEEEKFLKEELRKVWESIPEMDVDKEVEKLFEGDIDEE